MKLTTEEKRIKIAEACGWVPTPAGNWTQSPNGIPNAQFITHYTLPDYFNDLNAMHLAFKSLKLVQQCKWHEELRRVLKSEAAHKVDEASIDWLCDNATATQRAEAFGLTLNLWTYDEP